MHRGVEDVARTAACSVRRQLRRGPRRERELAEAFAARGVDGLIIVPSGDDQSYLQRDSEAGIALVFVDRPPRFIDADAVVSDNAAGGAARRRAPVAGGHRRIAFLGDRQRLAPAPSAGAAIATRWPLAASRRPASGWS